MTKLEKALIIGCLEYSYKDEIGVTFLSEEQQDKVTSIIMKTYHELKAEDGEVKLFEDIKSVGLKLMAELESEAE